MFQNRLKELREAAGFKSQASFAEKFKVSQSAVGNWEAGAREPNYETTVRLAQFFHVSVGYLLGVEDIYYFSSAVSKKICTELAAAFLDSPELFEYFFIPPQVKSDIMAGTYIFSTATFPQFSKYLSSSLADLTDEISSNADSYFTAENIAMIRAFDAADDYDKVAIRSILKKYMPQQQAKKEA